MNLDAAVPFEERYDRVRRLVDESERVHARYLIKIVRRTYVATPPAQGLRFVAAPVLSPG